MAQQFTAIIASGSTNGRMIKVAVTGTPGTLLHTAVAGTSSMDEIEIWAVNSSAADVKLTIEWGGVASPDDLIEETIPAESGKYYIVTGERLQNSLEVRAFAATANVIMCSVRVNRIV